MKQFRNLFLFISLLLAAACFGQTPDGFSKVSDVTSFKNKVKVTSQQTNSISSDFTQEKHLTMMEEVLISQGRFWFKKENKVKWEYYKPINYAIIINQNSFIINNDGKISEFDTGSNKLFKEINSMIVMAIQGNFVDNPDFTSGFHENDKKYLAVLTPQNELLKGILTQIEIYFRKPDMAVAEVKFIEPGEDFTKIIFTNRKVNIEINDDQFKAK